MSDDPHTAPPAEQTPNPAPHGIHEHWCQHLGCKAWGSFGYSPTRDRTDWYCFEHRPAEA